MTTYGQHDHTLHFMPDIGQYSYTNPAFRPNYKVTIGLPGISSNYLAVTNSGFKYKNLVSRREDGALFLTLDNFVDKLGKHNYIQANANVDLLHLTFKANPRLSLSMNVSAKTYKRFMYPRDLFAFAIKGNGSFVGETLSLSPKMESTSYIELGFGGSYRVNEKLTVGSRLKLLRGLENVTTKQSDLLITTHEENYDITVKAGTSVITSNIRRLENEDIELANAGEYLNNKGYAVDFGATYTVNDRITVGLSLLDIGSIKWTEDTYEYFMDPDKAVYTFTGAEIDKLIEGESAFDGIGDSIEANFQFEERAAGTYWSALPAKTYLSGTYALSNTVTTGGAFFMEKFRERWNGGFSMNIAKEFGGRMAASLSYSMMNRAYDNVGAGLSLNLTPLQIYLVSDNLMNAAYHGLTKGVINDYINNVKSVNLRFGINLVFGREKDPAGQFSN